LTYSILLIITDGDIQDIDETKKAIENACDKPLSIIIIGVGNGDFSNMIELDGDHDPITYHKNDFSSRDIVQFVK
jgi:hypothetical protein